MERREFLLGLISAHTAFAVGKNGLLSALGPLSAGQGTQLHTTENGSLDCMLYGPPLFDTDLDAWFATLGDWKLSKWMAYAFPLHPRWVPYHGAVPFIGDLLPEFRAFLQEHPPTEAEESIRKQQQLCELHGIKFWYALPFPMFPSLDPEEVQRALPSLFHDGKLNLYDPYLPKILKAQVRAVKQALPALQGVSLWFAEGAGSLTDYTRDDLAHVDEWLLPLTEAFLEVLRELHIEGMVFAHNYQLTVGQRTGVYDVLAKFPSLSVMEDVNWPQEDMLHPFFGFMTQAQRSKLLKSNKVDANFLLDAEYTGQGVLPSVYPRWWKYSVLEAVRSGCSLGMGRVFLWDGGLTDVNFNRMNSDIFVHLCRAPGQDLRALFGAAAHDMFGPAIPEQLIEILWQTEPVMRKVIGIDGIVVMDHSSFPDPEQIDVLYMTSRNPMNAIDDLFEPPGTPLYPKLTDSLNNYKEWRWQSKTVSKPASEYLARKQEAIDWIDHTLPEVKRLAAALVPAHRTLFVRGYTLMSFLARGMKLFVEAAFVHHEWAHDKTIDDPTAHQQFAKISASFRSLAQDVPENPFSYRKRFLKFAEFLDSLLPRPYSY